MGSDLPLSPPCHLSADCTLSQGSVALEILSLPLYFWVSGAGGLGVFLPPGVCLRSVFPRLTQTEPKILENNNGLFKLTQLTLRLFIILRQNEMTVWFNYLQRHSLGIGFLRLFSQIGCKAERCHKVKFCLFVWGKLD